MQELFREHEKLITRKNVKAKSGNGLYDRYVNQALTAGHSALFWRYGFEYESNQHLMERIGANAAFNAGAMEYDGNYLVLARVEGVDKKAFRCQGLAAPGGAQGVRQSPLTAAYPAGSASE